MVENAGGDITTMSPEKFDRLVAGIRGIMTHEFTHPKQDELVKWDWRQSQGNSRQNHAQIDELTTDLMSMYTLKDAKLDPTDILTGLELVIGEKTERGNYTNRSIEAATSSHPQDNLRLNMVRGGLTKMRLEEGFSKPDPIATDKDALTASLGLIARTSSGARAFKMQATVNAIKVARQITCARKLEGPMLRMRGRHWPIAHQPTKPSAIPASQRPRWDVCA